jgi:hypothetical protein
MTIEICRCMFRSKTDSIPEQGGHCSGGKRTPYRSKADTLWMR